MDSDKDKIIADILSYVKEVIKHDSEYIQLQNLLEIKNIDEVIESLGTDTVKSSMAISAESRGLLLIAALTDLKLKNLYYTEIFKMVDLHELAALINSKQNENNLH